MKIACMERLKADRIGRMFATSWYTVFCHSACCVYRTITLPVVLYETWSLTLRKEHRLRVFENRVVRRIFGPNRDEVTGE
jgi:hypothetical protein